MNRIKFLTFHTIFFVLVFSLARATTVLANSPDKKKQTATLGTKNSNVTTKNLQTKPSYYRFIGNTYSKKYHKPSCEYAKKMNASHVKLLKTTNQAKISNFKQCNWCLPHWTKSVSSKLLKTAK